MRNSTGLTGVVLLALLASGLIGWVRRDDPEIPPPDKWVAVKSVPEEYTLIGRERCKCGGSYTIVRQGSGSRGNKRYDLIETKCSGCSEPRRFFFDVTSLFDAMKRMDSASEGERVRAEMNRRFPRVTEAQVAEIAALLRDRDPLVRVWAIETLGGVDAEEARVALLDGFLRTGITDIQLRMAY